MHARLAEKGAGLSQSMAQGPGHQQPTTLLLACRNAAPPARCTPRASRTTKNRRRRPSRITPELAVAAQASEMLRLPPTAKARVNAARVSSKAGNTRRFLHETKSCPSDRLDDARALSGGRATSCRAAFLACKSVKAAPLYRVGGKCKGRTNFRPAASTAAVAVRSLPERPTPTAQGSGLRGSRCALEQVVVQCHGDQPSSSRGRGGSLNMQWTAFAASTSGLARRVLHRWPTKPIRSQCRFSFRTVPVMFTGYGVRAR